MRTTAVDTTLARTAAGDRLRRMSWWQPSIGVVKIGRLQTTKGVIIVASVKLLRSLLRFFQHCARR